MCKGVKVLGHILDVSNILILVDGNYFKPYTVFDENAGELICYRAETVIKGDGSSIFYFSEKKSKDP